MDVADPRTAYDDLIVSSGQQMLTPDEFDELANSEVATVGWLVLALVFDEDGRVLLIDQPWADGWLAPGGALTPGETLSEAAAREVREETGVTSRPVRPHAVDEVTFVNEKSGDTAGWTTVFFEADAVSTKIKSDLGIEDENINEAEWFAELPDHLFNPELAEPVYQRCIRDRRSG